MNDDFNLTYAYLDGNYENNAPSRWQLQAADGGYLYIGAAYFYPGSVNMKGVATLTGLRSAFTSQGTLVFETEIIASLEEAAWGLAVAGNSVPEYAFELVSVQQVSVCPPVPFDSGGCETLDLGHSREEPTFYSIVLSPTMLKCYIDGVLVLERMAIGGTETRSFVPIFSALSGGQMQIGPVKFELMP